LRPIMTDPVPAIVTMPIQFSRAPASAMATSSVATCDTWGWLRAGLAPCRPGSVKPRLAQNSIRVDFIAHLVARARNGQADGSDQALASLRDAHVIGLPSRPFRQDCGRTRRRRSPPWSSTGLHQPRGKPVTLETTP
jgi:hypothetical protein